MRRNQAIVDHREAGFEPLAGIEPVAGVDPPAPFEPQRARRLRVEVVLDLEPELARERLGAGPDEQVVVGEFGHRLRDERRSADALERRDAPGPASGSVHAARIELDDAVRVGESAVSDPHLRRVVLGDVHARREGVEHILALDDAAEGALDGTLGSAVVEADPAEVGDDDGPGHP